MLSTRMRIKHQSIFNKVVKHLRAQKCRSIKGKTCMYRDKNGNKCAFGCIIPDHIYERNMEGLSTNLLLSDPYKWKYPKFFTKLLPYGDLISQLRIIHDRKNISEWEYHFQDVAREFGLTYTPTEQ